MHSRTFVFTLIACGLAACQPMWAAIPTEEKAGYKAAAYLIGALEKFHQERAHYPAALRELVPHYVRHVRETEVLGTWDRTKPFNYRSDRNAYTLNFSFFQGVTIES